MKRTTRLTSRVALALGTALGCNPGPAVPPPIGGQSGDDGGGHDPDNDPSPPPIPPGIPEPPCDPIETALSAGDTSAFGASVQGLIENLELGGDSPLFWVPFDSVVPAAFAPGPGQTTFALAIELRPGELAQQIVQITGVGGAVCPRDVVSVPVEVTLTTADGALDERFDATLEFTNADVAHLSGELLPDELGGTFAFGPLGAPANGVQLQALDVEVALWPGGSRGTIRPRLIQTGLVTPPAVSAAPGVLPADAPLPAPLLPDHWSAVAVWPRREVCPNDGRAGVVVDASDAVIGSSPLDAVDALGQGTTWSLATDEGEVSVRMAIEPPNGLVCATTDGPTLELDVRATLRAENAPAGSSLEHLEASTILRVGARAAADGSGLVELRWARRDAVWSQERDAFEAATGIALDAPDEYRDIWWSWHGLEARAATAAPWSTEAAFSVRSLNAEQAAAVARIVAQGGPGPGVSQDAGGFPVLPGDSLIDVALAP